MGGLLPVQMVDSEKTSMLVSLCFALSLLGRRALGAASNNSSGYDVLGIISRFVSTAIR